MPDTDISKLLPDSATEPPPEESPKKRLNRRRWIWALVILLIICYIVNGPFARWLVLYGLNKGLEDQGMRGNAKVIGTLSEGFTIHDLSYSGDQGLQSLEASELAAHYKFTELLSGRVRNINLSDAKVTIDFAKFPKSQEQKDTDTQLRETLATLHPWVNQPEISISNLDIHVFQSGKKQAQFQLSKFAHQAKSNEFTMTGFTAIDREGRSTPKQDIRIIWKPESASINRFELLPDIAVENVAINWSSDFHGEGLVKLLNANLRVIATSTITAELTGGNINSQELQKRFDLELPADFSIAGINLTIDEWLKPIPQWDIHAKLELASAKYQDYQLADTTIQLTQKNHTYQLSVVGDLNTTPVIIKVDGKWLSPASEQWWSHSTAHYDINVPKLGKLTKLIKGLPQDINMKSTTVSAKGDLIIKDNSLSEANTQSQVSSIFAGTTAMPAITLNASYKDDGQSRAKITAQRNGAIVLQLDAGYHLESSAYEGTLKLNEAAPDWVNAIAKVFEVEAKLDGPVALAWAGQGNTSNFSDPKLIQKGNLMVEKLQVTLPDTPTLNITSEINYSWPESVNLTSLTISENEWLGTAALVWNGKIIDISGISLKQADREFATLSGKIPFRKEIDSSQKFLAQTAPWNLSAKTQPIALKKLQEWLKIDTLDKLSGTTDLNFEFSGSPNNPEVKGSARASDIKVVDETNLLPLHLACTFYSENNQLIVKGNLLEGTNERFSLKGALPFSPSNWVRDPDFIDKFVSNAPLSAEVKINTLPLGRLKKFVPQLEKITGTINGTATLSGTIAEPKYLVDIDADVPLLRIEKSDIGGIRNIKLNTKFTESQKANTKLTALINGGKFEAGGSVDITDIENPIFDLYLRTQYAMVHRDDMVSIRANSDLTLKGKMEDATLSGTIGIAESLFYKDIELIPIGVPSSEVAKVNMPALSKKKSDERLPIPEPFANWKLNLTVRTDDPVLIRGNVASGNLTGSIKVGGTLAKPAPLGTILVNKVKAKLPFSILKIQRGEIKFHPKNGLDPILNIRGKSTVGAHDVSVFVYGSASSPKTAFTSFPPLPESEVMTLIATGTTTTGLEDRSVATFKAFQIFLMKLQQRNDTPGGNKLFKTLLSGIDDLNLNVGETDPFTGRKFTSATIDVHKNWNFTAQVDDTQQTRGLMVYIIRFR